MKHIYYKYLRQFLMICILLFCSIIGINYFLDGGNYFYRSNKYENDLTTALLEKNNVLICSNYNDRNIKKILLLKVFKQPDLLIFGSSRTMAIDNTLFTNYSLFNSSVTSGTLEDDIALYYLYQKRGWKPKLIILGLDPWIISNGSSTKWKTVFLSEYWQANKLFFNQQMDISNYYYQYINSLIEKNLQLISPSYLKESLSNVKLILNKQSTIIINPSLDQINQFPACYLQFLNGTRLTSLSEEKTLADQADYAGSIEMHRLTPSELNLNKQKMYEFEEFINYLTHQGIQIIFYLTPYEPAAYAEIKKNPNLKSFDIIEKYFTKIAFKYHIKLIGSYNPSALNLSSNDFIDEIHLKKKGINKIFSHGLDGIEN